MKAVQELIAYFDKQGKLPRRRLLKMLEDNHIASVPPVSMHGLCDKIGATYYFRITGVTEGQIWGTDIYTRDSTIGAAAVHLGLLKPGESAVLRLTIVPAQKAYPGSTRNGVTTNDYGDYPECWRLTAL